MHSQEAKEFSIKDIFSSDRYVIPLYQRNYAWTEKEVLQLIHDIVDYAKEKPNSIYRIGTLIVYKRDREHGGAYETIDGQQRLTTLSILLCVLKHKVANQLAAGQSAALINWFELNLTYDSRPADTDTLRALFQGEPDRGAATGRPSNDEIRQAYDLVTKALKNLQSEKGLSVADFYEYLTQCVKILRVPVPPDTNLNHYFEIMNSRGEQLEKHEVLKAKLLEILQGHATASHCFTRIWEACADMERYVQYGFTKVQREALFGDQWTRLKPEDFEAVRAVLSPERAPEQSQTGQKDGKNNEETEDIFYLERILRSEEAINNNANESDQEGTGRFNSVISFPNFLLHVLRTQVAREDLSRGQQVALDDKTLLKAFDEHLFDDPKRDTAAKETFVKTFAFNLLKCRNLLDTYVLKREYTAAGDGWSLKALRKGSSDSGYYADTFPAEPDGTSNREVLMLLAMFHVSTPTQSYKHWLNAALKYLIDNVEPTAAAYRNHLQQLADAFLFNRFLTNDKQDYYQLIYGDESLKLNQNPNAELLNQGTAVENFVFNYLDFLLWKDEPTKAPDFEFNFRSSVEHHYPQNPPEGIRKLSTTSLNHFGNLCLIKASQNSKLSNHLPSAKKDYYDNKNERPDSLKQRLMLAVHPWNEDAIERHGVAMTAILCDRLANAVNQ